MSAPRAIGRALEDAMLERLVNGNSAVDNLPKREADMFKNPMVSKRLYNFMVARRGGAWMYATASIAIIMWSQMVEGGARG